ncbi:MAG TPA: hypothetical protein VL754_02720 [Verrucomicrobiae bacterium]|jgi:hypothetical protein|nr:hypothetical protein [Verrucomicrobiae bacterium]
MAKRDAHDVMLKRGLERLRQAGIDAPNVSGVTSDSITRLLGQHPESDLAIAFLLGRLAVADAVDALLAIEKTATSKELKREARRSLFKLEQRGLTVHRAEAAEREKQPVLGAGPDIEGYLAVIDGAGDRLVWLARPRAGGGLQLLQAMVSDRRGLLRSGGAAIKRKDLRAQAEEIRKDRGIAMTPVPWEYADAIVYEAYEQAKAQGQSTAQFSSMRAAFNPMKPKEAPHPVYGRLNRQEAQGEDWRALSRRLLDEPEFRFWILDEDWIKPYRERVAQAQESRLVLNEAQKEERIGAIIREAAREIFSGESGRVFKRRMEDMALCLLQSSRKTAALSAFAVALKLEEGDIGLLDISFLTGLVQKSLAFYITQDKQKSDEEPSLIVKP